MMRGHNENAVRLSILAEDAQRGLERVAQGEADAVEGWLSYGAALNEGRALFPGDKEFGRWLSSSNLDKDIHPGDQQAAMWAASNADQVEAARASCNARTLRGLHDRHKKLEAEQEAERIASATRQAEAEAQAEAAAQRKKAEASAQAEAEARKAAVEAKTDADRAEAEAKAAKEAAARVEAEAAAAQAEKDAANLAPTPEDPHKKIRAEFRKLTKEAQEEDWVGLRNENAEMRKRIASQRDMIADLKMKIKDFSSDKDAVIARLQKTVEHKNSEMFRANEETARAMKQVHALKKRVTELEDMGIAL